MLTEQTLEKLTALKLNGMANALREWLAQPKEKQLAPADLIGLLADAEWLSRENRRLSTRLKNAKLRQSACVEDINYAYARGLSKPVILDLASSRWVASHQNIILTGPTGVGKSYLACALANKACRDGYSVVYRRASRLLDELAQARADGTFHALLRRLAKVQVLVLDDFALETLGANERKHLHELLEDRCGISSLIITSQRDPKDWPAVISEGTVADAICDRVVHNAHRIKLSGESIRKLEAEKVQKHLER